MSKRSFLVKIVLVGDETVGKTTFRHQYLDECFQQSHLLTTGCDFAIKRIEVAKRRIKFQLWELAAQPRFQELRAVYYRGALGGLIMFDVSNWRSFQSLPRWIDEMWQANGRGCIPVVLLGNKGDLQINEVESVPETVAKKYAQAVSEVTRAYGFSVPYIEISTKTGKQVEDAFYTLGSCILAYLDEKPN